MTLRRAIVIGHGAAPAMAALALRRAFGRGRLAVEWIETPGEIPAGAVLPALPNLRVFHRLLGIGEGQLLRACVGAFSLGEHFIGFAGRGGGFLRSYGPVGRPVEGLPFIQFWLKARAAGLPAGFGDFAREAVAARNGRIRIDDSRTAPATAHGYHLDACAYAAMIRERAVTEGVTVTPASAAEARIEAGRVMAVQLSGDRQVDGDWFIDATPGATILSALGDGSPEDTAVSGCDRLMIGSARALQPLPLYSRIAAHAAGWAGLYPLQGRTGVVVAYDSALLSEDAAVPLAGVELDGPPVFAPLRPFERRQPWIGNAVAIGTAAGSAEPLAVPDLHRVQTEITHLVSLLPVRADTMPEAGIYNEELGGWRARMSDFNALHYALARRDEPFWQAARARPVSADLDARISLFHARGMVAQYNQDSFAEDEWQACFLGHGLAPRSWDPQVDRVDEQAAMADFRNQLASIRADVTAMETHAAALARAMGR